MKKFVNILAMALLVFGGCTSGNDPVISQEMHKSTKRGACFSFANAMDLPLMTPGISWYYNWGNVPNSTAASWFDGNNVDFCPMIWNGNYSAAKIREYVAAHPNTKYLLAFNEPNLTDQANMTPARAAELWPPVVALAKELKLKLVAPAMNYGTLTRYNKPIKWMDEFLAQPGVSLDDIDAMSLHCYMVSTGGLKEFVESFYKYNKPIWMTEFCPWEGNPSPIDVQLTYMSTVLNYFEQNEHIERYSWFMPRSDKRQNFELLTHDTKPSLTELGRVYCGFSSFDKSVALNLNSPIYGNQYVGVSSNNVVVKPTNEDSEHLMVCLNEGDWTEYQVYAEQDKPLSIHYSTAVNSKIVISIDGHVSEEVELPKTGFNKWSTFECSTLKSGKHTIRVAVSLCGIYLGWIAQ